MATIKRFDDLEVWQKARELCTLIYPLTLKDSFARDFKLRDQINGSAGSIMNNIAEGFERDGKGEFRQFLSISKGSCGEVRSQLYRAIDRNHISRDEFQKCFALAEETSKKLSSFIAYLNTSEIRGLKFRTEPKT
ncbi:MAG: four helix bundle protein [Bacteroidetes bacterium]|nr:MAG: four helix bundle protein [Bacteroidota bacterium]